jgi:hypothetical protein
MNMKKSKPGRLPWLALIMVLGLAAGNNLWAWGGKPHAVITRAALEVLPGWEKEIWKDLLPKIIEEYCLIPDKYLSRPDLAGYAILDDYQVKFTEYDYRIQQEFYIRNGHYHLPCDQKMNFRIYEFFLERIVSSLKAKRIEDAAKFAGVLLHVIEDFSAPSHSVTGDNQFYLFMQFLPPPEKFQYARLHGPIESGNVTAKIPDYRPKLLGESPSEAAFHLHRLMNQNIIQARGKVIPIIQAIYREDAPAADAENSVMAARAAQVAADMLPDRLRPERRRRDHRAPGIRYLRTHRPGGDGPGLAAAAVLPADGLPLDKRDPGQAKAAAAFEDDHGPIGKTDREDVRHGDRRGNAEKPHGGAVRPQLYRARERL